MGTFFIDWPLWVQMTFVLGASITVTISMGVLKLFWAKHKLRKDTKAETEKMIEDLQSQNETLKDDIRTGRIVGDHDVPLNMQFGTEQLKYGGIYNNGIPNMSHPGTPRTSTFPTPNASFCNLDKLGKQYTPSTSSLQNSRPLVSSHLGHGGAAHSTAGSYAPYDSPSQLSSQTGSTKHSPEMDAALPYEHNMQRSGSAYGSAYGSVHGSSIGSVSGLHLDQPGSRYPPAPAGVVPDLTALGLSRPLIPAHHQSGAAGWHHDGSGSGPDSSQVLSPPSPYPATFRVPQQHLHPNPGFPGSQGV